MPLQMSVVGVIELLRAKHALGVMAKDGAMVIVFGAVALAIQKAKLLQRRTHLVASAGATSSAGTVK